jgi:gentisate 1,2-dioxygenase
VSDRTWDVNRGDLFVVPSWAPFSVQAGGAAHLDLFRFSDAPIFEALHTHRAEVVE